MTLMFCSFSHKPMILRLYGQGRVVRSRDKEWQQLYPLFEPIAGVRQIIVLQIESIQKSCGYAVPIYEFKTERLTLRRWLEKKGEDEIRRYWKEKNDVSIDGLPTNLLTD
jgi:hypothetical protein